MAGEWNRVENFQSAFRLAENGFSRKSSARRKSE